MVILFLWAVSGGEYPWVWSEQQDDDTDGIFSSAIAEREQYRHRYLNILILAEKSTSYSHSFMSIIAPL